ncbi:flippase [Morganella morganii]|uniref:flippase n=1 Tax=Morganella morganii TaxID=582 RepID=UPI00164A99BE|nr:flippase [Morganella morganii]MBC4012519.1 flippase [Morganella morganii]
MKKNIFYLFIVQGGQYLLPLIAFPYLVITLGPYNFGLLSLSIAIIQYIVLITDYGFNLTGTQQISINRNKQKNINLIFSSIIISKLILFFISISLLYITVSSFKELSEIKYVVLCLIPFIIGNIIFPTWLFQGLEDMKWISLCSILAKLLTLPLIFLLVKTKNDILIAALLHGLPNIISGLLAIFIIRSKKIITSLVISTPNVCYQLKSSWHIFLSNSAISLYSNSLIVMLGYFSSPIYVGYFNTANTVKSAAQGLLNPIAQAIYPRISILMQQDRIKAIALIKKCFTFFVSITFLGSSFLYFLSDDIITIFFGKEYHSSIPILQTLSFIPFVVSISNILGIQTMLTQGYKKQFTKIILLGGIFGFLISIPLISQYQAIGTSISILLSEIFISVAMIIYVTKFNLMK